MRKTIRLLIVCALILLPAISVAAERFDGNWSTKLTCPAKGSTEGYTWRFASVILNSNLRGEHGTAGEPGYLLIAGKIAEDGSAKLSANGIVETEGTATRNEGLGIVGRACTIEFVKQPAESPAGGR
jgi:hypothetical protein